MSDLVPLADAHCSPKRGQEHRLTEATLRELLPQIPGWELVEDGLALIGDAAHGMHPIAGQGLNLGLRDVGALVEVMVEGMRLGLEPGDAQVLARYERWRSLDSFSVMAATDGINRLFGVPGRLPSAVRRLGLGMIQRMPPLKSWFMDEARGVSGRLPELLQG